MATVKVIPRAEGSEGSRSRLQPGANDFCPVAPTCAVMKCVESLSRVSSEHHYAAHSTPCGSPSNTPARFQEGELCADAGLRLKLCTQHKMVSRLREVEVNVTLCSWLVSSRTDSPEGLSIGNYTPRVAPVLRSTPSPPMTSHLFVPPASSWSLRRTHPISTDASSPPRWRR